MIKKLEITGIHIDTNKKIQNYVKKKIAKLDIYMPKHARKSAHAEVKLKESKARDKKQCTAEVTIFLPGETITAKETTFNLYAAIDIVEEKLKTQLRRYKQQNIAKSSKGVRKIRSILGKIVRKK
jgi:putative sigma-54 modulation protein